MLLRLLPLILLVVQIAGVGASPNPVPAALEMKRDGVVGPVA